MLKLLIFAPCDKVIVAERGQSSLVGVLESIQLGLPEGKQLVADAMIPYKWSILVLWHREDDVPQPINYFARIILLRPDAVQALEIGASFEVSNAFKNFRQNIDLPFLPAGTPGEHLLKLFLRQEGGDEEAIAAFPIIITHNVAKNVEIKEEQGRTTMTVTNDK